MLATPKSLAFLALTLLTLVACSAPPQQIFPESAEGTLYSRVGMRGRQSRANTNLYETPYLSHEAVLPAGSEVEIKRYTNQFIELTVDGQSCRMLPVGDPFPTDNRGVETFLGKRFTDDEPDLSWIDEGRRKAIMSGNPPIGATKEEVLVSLGYPAAVGNDQPALEMSRDELLEHNRWIYNNGWWLVTTSVVYFDFDRDGQLQTIIR